MLLQVLICCALSIQIESVQAVPVKKNLKAIPSLTVLFSPADKPAERLIELIDGAKKSITAAIYMLTDKKIADALITAKKERRVVIRLVLDPISAGKYGKADYLIANNIPIYIYKPSAIRPWFTPIMHHKFAVFDDTILWTGSFNWTVSANISNAENILISTDSIICRMYKAYFETLVSQKCEPYSPAKNPLDQECSSLHDSLNAILNSHVSDDIMYEQTCLILQEYNTSRSSIDPL